MPDSFKLFHQLAACTKDLIFVYDHSSNTFPFISLSASTFIGISAEKIKEDPGALLVLLQPDDRDYVLNELQSLREGNLCIDIECRLFTASQKTKWLHLKAYLLEEAQDATHVAGIVTDITHKKEYELSLLTIKDQKDITLQILSHDLRSPLNTITLVTQLLEKEIEGDDREKVQKYLKLISTTCRNSLDLIGEVLNVEYLEAQQMGLKLQRFDVVSRIQLQMDAYLLSRNSGKRFWLETSAEAVYLISDTMRFQLILENLLSNAFKFTGAEGEIKVTVAEKGDVVLISVADNGIGIPERLQPMIFDKFTKARRAGQQGEKPVGLGMHLVRTLVEQIGGHLWFESQEGKGTTFFVELPASLDANSGDARATASFDV